MYFDIDTIIKTELQRLQKICKTLESTIQENTDSKKITVRQYIKNSIGQLYMLSTTEGMVYHQRRYENGVRVSHMLGGADDVRVIKIKQKVFDIELLRSFLYDLNVG